MGYGFYLLWDRVEPAAHHLPGSERPDGGWFWERQQNGEILNLPNNGQTFMAMYGEDEFYLYGDSPDGGYWRMNCPDKQKMMVRSHPHSVEIKCGYEH